MSTTIRTDEMSYLRAQVAEAERRIRALTREQSIDERNEIAQAMTRADGVAAYYGHRAPPPIPGETASQYRCRLLESFKKYSPRFKAADLSRLDAAMIPSVEDYVYHDAQASAVRSESHAAGTLTPVTTHEAGRAITRFCGDPLGWMAPFMRGGQVGRFVASRS